MYLGPGYYNIAQTTKARMTAPFLTRQRPKDIFNLVKNQPGPADY